MTDDSRASQSREFGTRLVLVRHGHALNSEKRCVGHTDLPLSPDGEHAFRELVKDGAALRAIASNGGLRIVSSDLMRAVASARIIAEVAARDVEYDARLREMNFGEWDGRTWDEIGSVDGARLQAWMDDWVNVPAPRGEGPRDVAARAASWLEAILDPPRDAARTVIAVAHAGWIRAVIAQLTHHPLERMFELPADHARATLVHLSPAGNEIIASNVERLA